MKTRAAILVEQHQPLVIDEIKLPQKLEVGQVLVEVIASGICGSQIGEINGVKGPDRFLPHLMGHEGCGKVLTVGDGVKTVQVGDKVVLHWRPGDGIQSDPPRYKWGEQSVSAGWVTTFNQHAIVSENRCTKINLNTDPEIAALFGCAITTGFGVVENNAKLKMGETVVIFGAGGIGLNIIQAASLVSASTIIAVDIYDNPLKLAKELGATHCINSKKMKPEIGIRDALKGKGLDVFIDNTGKPEIIELGYRVTHEKGRIVLVGVPRIGTSLNLYSLPMHFGKTLIGSHGGECKPEKDISRYMRMQNDGKLKLEKLITGRYNLNEINDAIDDMQSGKAIGRNMIYF